MPDRRLLVGEFDATDAAYGEMFALAPNTATGVPIPAFRIGATKPATGSIVGEGFYESNTSKGFVWTGSAWYEIAASPVKSFATEKALLADKLTRVGSFAVAADTGGTFVKQTNGWQFIGIRDFATAALLLAATPTAGSLAVALNENSLWQMTKAGWRCLSVRELADTAAVMAWAVSGGGTPGLHDGVHVGDTAVDALHGVSYVRTSAGWKPDTIWEETEANIRAATWCRPGQSAIATDTGRTFVRTTTGWVEEPIQHYATEAALLAAAAQNGTLAWADDTNVVFTRAAGVWHRLQGPQITVGATRPSTPGAGDQHLVTPANRLEVFTGTAWAVPQAVGGLVGTIIQSMLTEAQFNTAAGDEATNWMLADGRSCAGTTLATITGWGTVPDLRGAFLRMAGTNASNGNWVGGALNAFQEDSTARPKSVFTTDSQGNHTHDQHPGTGSTWFQNYQTTGGTWPREADGNNTTRPTSAAGAHTHTIVGGGDVETRPKSYAVNYFVKVK